MTEEQLNIRLSYLEKLMAKASAKDLPYLVATYNKVMDRLVQLDKGE